MFSAASHLFVFLFAHLAVSANAEDVWKFAPRAHAKAGQGINSTPEGRRAYQAMYRATYKEDLKAKALLKAAKLTPEEKKVKKQKSNVAQRKHRAKQIGREEHVTEPSSSTMSTSKQSRESSQRSETQAQEGTEHVSVTAGSQKEPAGGPAYNLRHRLQTLGREHRLTNDVAKTRKKFDTAVKKKVNSGKISDQHANQIADSLWGKYVGSQHPYNPVGPSGQSDSPAPIGRASDLHANHAAIDRMSWREIVDATDPAKTGHTRKP